MIQSDNEDSERSVQKHREDYRPVDRTLDEPKSEWPSVTSVSMVSQHDDQSQYRRGLCRDVLAKGMVGVRWWCLPSPFPSNRFGMFPILHTSN